MSTVTLPPTLAQYLPPDLWQRLVTDGPRQGLLLNALDRLRSLLFALETYLPAHLVQEKKRHPLPGLVTGQRLTGSLLFADVSGFTAMSERLAIYADGAEQLTQRINDYFEQMLDILARSGGILLKFAGDALLAYFPQQEANEQARWAVRAGQRMMHAMAQFAHFEPPLQMKLSIGTGAFLAASVGNAERMEYVVLGDTVTRTMAGEAAATAGQVVVDTATAAALDPVACHPLTPGIHLLAPSPEETLGDFEIKVEPRRVRGTVPWSAEPQEVADQVEATLRQIQALTPYLAAEVLRSLVARAGQRQIANEFRPTVVLFANFTGLEPLLSAWGDEASQDGEPVGLQRVTHLLNDYFNAAHRVITSYGGMISRIDPYRQGSKLLVLFGAPVVHEGGSQRAVHVALEMNAALAGLNQQWRATLADHLPPKITGALVQQRIGITKGNTFACQAGTRIRREYTVMGDDVNLAARLMAAAQPGQILLHQGIYDDVADYFEITALKPITVKGKSQPVAIYQIEGHRDNPLARRLRRRGPTFGRGRELEQGKALLRQVIAGQGACLHLQGPAGIGKSHLADALVAVALAQGMRVLFGECNAYTAEIPYAPWSDLVLTLAGITSTDPPPRRREKLTHLITHLELDAATHEPPLANLLGLGDTTGLIAPRQMAESPPVQPAPTAPQQAQPALFDRLQQKVGAQPVEKNGKLDFWQLARKRGRRRAGEMWQRLQVQVTAREQERLFEAFTTLLTRLSANGPLVIFLENAQWMDLASRELLGHLGEQLHAWPILILVAERTEEGERGTFAPAQAAVHIAGQVLTQAWTQVWPLQPLSQDCTTALAAHLLDEAPWVPQLGAAIYERTGGNPLFIEELARWLHRQGVATSTPAAILAALAEGLRASGTVQELILSRLDALPYSQRDTAKAASVIGDQFNRSALRSLLPPTTSDAALDADLVGLGEARLIVPIVVADADPRFSFHHPLIREVVYDSISFTQRREWHAQVAADLEAMPGRQCEDWAELLAHHYFLAARWLPAARYLLLSGHRARRRYAYPQAANDYGRALTALSHLSPGDTDAGVIHLRAEAHEGMGDVALLTGDFAAAMAAYEQAQSTLPGDPPPPLSRKLALVLPTQGRPPEAETLARQALADPEASGHLAAVATLAWLLWRRGDGQATDWIQRGQTLARAGDDAWTAGVAALLADLAGEWQSAQAAYLALDRPCGAALAACRLGDQYLQQGKTDRATTLYERAAAIWEQMHDACGLALGRYRQAEAQWQAGNTTAARHTVAQASKLLADCPTADPHDQRLLQTVLVTLESNPAGPWPPWRWQRYDDAFRIAILFRP